MVRKNNPCFPLWPNGPLLLDPAMFLPLKQVKISRVRLTIMNLNRIMPTACSLALFAALSFLGSGCHSTPTPKPWNIKITKTTPATVDVDVIGVSSSDKQDWASYDLNKYWTPNDERRREALASEELISFSLKMGEASELKIDDKHWKKWLKTPTAERRRVPLRRLGGFLPPRTNCSISMRRPTLSRKCGEKRH